MAKENSGVNKEAFAKLVGGEVQQDGSIKSDKAAYDQLAEISGNAQENGQLDNGSSKPAEEQVKAESNKPEAEPIKEQPKPVEESKKEQSNSIEKSFDELIAEQSAGKFRTYRDIEDALNAPKVELYNEQAKIINDYLAGGGQLGDILYALTLDVENMSDMDAVKHNLKLNDPEITDQEIEFEMKRYKLDEDQHEESEIKDSKIMLARDARKAKKALKIAKDKMISSAPVDNSEKIRQQEEQKQRELKKAQDEWKKTVDASLKGYDKEVFTIGKDESFEYKVTSDMEALKQTMANPHKFFSRYLKEDGSTDVAKYRREIFVLENLDNIINAIASQARANGTKEIFKDLKNPDFDPKGAVPETGTKLVETQIAEQMRKKMIF